MSGAVFEGRFAGKVLGVTGAAQGIGLAVAARAVAEGGRVLFVDRADFVHEAAAAAGPKDRAMAFAVDLESHAGAAAAMQEAADRFGGSTFSSTMSAAPSACGPSRPFSRTRSMPRFAAR